MARGTGAEDPFRSRLSTRLAEALGHVEPERLPPALRRPAAFAPAKRARLAGEQVRSACEHDAALRALLAHDLRRRLVGTAADDPRDLAVLAWLERAEGWEDAVRRASQEERATLEQEQARVDAAEVERARRRADDAAEEAREVRRRSREDLAAARSENADLRRRLGQQRQSARALEAELSEARAAAGAASSAAAADLRSHEAETRQLRARITELERRLERAQQEARGERDEASVRARLLLDSVIDAATGLRRELALPPVELSPADRVDADDPEPGARASSGTGSLAADDPALLDQLLAVPRTHLIVDGYNVTKSAWGGSTLETQRSRLLTGLSGLAARTGAEVTVVFDAAEVSGPRPALRAPRGVRVRFSRPGQIADDMIRDFVEAEPEGRPLLVVTSDRAVVTDVVRRSGTRAVAAAALVRVLARA